MKLRIKGSSLRLRLTQGEMNQLAERGEVEERVPFAANANLTYRLKKDSTANAITATYSGNLMEIRVPERQALEWHRTDLVTLSHSQPVPGGELRIVLEKDWECLVPREGEDEADHFPHPEAGSGHKC
jgi:hypothetical protein